MSYNRQITINCENNPSAECTVEAALSIIGGKWKLKIYKALRGGVPERFSALVRTLGNISEKTLTAQLREMEKDGVITRMIFPEVPPRVEYQLTTLGRSLDGVFSSLDSWGKEYIQQKTK
jgi:DNA-binding HxlR family transcriptional regulator